MEPGVRLDKFLWAIRIFKSRSIATEAIEGGKVKLDNKSQKPSKKVKLSEVYIIKREQQILEIKVEKLIEKRVSAELAQECYSIISNNLEELKNQKSAFLLSNITRERGTGRPTKKDRREINDFIMD